MLYAILKIVASRIASDRFRHIRPDAKVRVVLPDVMFTTLADIAVFQPYDSIKYIHAAKIGNLYINSKILRPQN